MRRSVEVSFARVTAAVEAASGYEPGGFRQPTPKLQPLPPYRFSFRQFLALPATEISRLLSPLPPANQLAPGGGDSFFPLTPPSEASRIAQHLGVGFLFALIFSLIWGAAKRETLGPSVSATSPGFLGKSLLTDRNFALFFLLRIALMYLNQFQSFQESVMKVSGVKGTSIEGEFGQKLISVLDSYPLEGWFIVEALLGSPSSRSNVGAGWTFANLILAPALYLLIAESIRLILAGIFRHQLSPNFSGVARAIVYSGGGFAALLFAIQLSGSSTIPVNSSPSDNGPHANQSEQTSYAQTPFRRPHNPEETRRVFKWESEQAPWTVSINSSLIVPDRELDIGVDTRRFPTPLGVRPTSVDRLPEHCAFTQSELAAIGQNEVMSEIGRSWGALVNDPQNFREIIPERLLNTPVHDSFGLPSQFLTWFRYCHLRRLRMFGPLAAAAADDVANYLSDDNLSGYALEVLQKIGLPTPNFFAQQKPLEIFIRNQSVARKLLAILDTPRKIGLFVANPNSYKLQRLILFDLVQGGDSINIPMPLVSQLQELTKSSELGTGARNLAYLIVRIIQGIDTRGNYSVLKNCPYESAANDLKISITNPLHEPNSFSPEIYRPDFSDNLQINANMKLWSSLPALEYRATFIAAEAYLYGKMRKAKKLSGVTVGECERLLYGEVWRELFLKTNYKYTFDGSPICGTKSVSEINLESLKHFVLLAAITSLNSRADPPSGQIEQIINELDLESVGKCSKSLSLLYPQILKEGLLPLLWSLPQSSNDTAPDSIDLLRSLRPGAETVVLPDTATPQLRFASKMISVARKLRHGLVEDSAKSMEEAKTELNSLLPSLSELDDRSVSPLIAQSFKPVVSAIVSHPQTSIAEGIELLLRIDPNREASPLVSNSGVIRSSSDGNYDQIWGSLRPLKDSADIQPVLSVIEKLPTSSSYRDRVLKVLLYLSKSGGPDGNAALNRIADGGLGVSEHGCRFTKWQELARKIIGVQKHSIHNDRAICERSPECERLIDLFSLYSEEVSIPVIAQQSEAVLNDRCCGLMNSAVKSNWSKEIVGNLLKRGAPVNIRQDGKTPLMIVAEKGRVELISPLVEKLRSEVAENGPLESEALITGLENPAVVSEFVKLNTPLVQDPNGRLPLHELLWKIGPRLSDKDRTKPHPAYESIIERGDPLARDGAGNTAFHHKDGFRLPGAYVEKLLKERREELIDALKKRNCTGDLAARDERMSILGENFEESRSSKIDPTLEPPTYLEPVITAILEGSLLASVDG